MSDSVSARHRLPYLFAGQAQKEIAHNEALALIDVLLHPAVEGEQASPPANLASGDSGKCWLIAAGGTSEWLGHDGDIACWTGGSWRFSTPLPGMGIWDHGTGNVWAYLDGQWSPPSPIPDASGGNVVDIEARAIINQLLQRMRDIGLVDG